MHINMKIKLEISVSIYSGSRSGLDSAPGWYNFFIFTKHITSLSHTQFYAATHYLFARTVLQTLKLIILLVNYVTAIKQVYVISWYKLPVSQLIQLDTTASNGTTVCYIVLGVFIGMYFKIWYKSCTMRFFDHANKQI